MDIYLVRHAIAHDRDSARWPDDSQRPLTPGGEDKFRRGAQGLSRIVSEVEVVLSSPFTRAWRTAELLQDVAGWPDPVRCEALESGGQATGALEALRKYGAASSVALVGHEPDLSELAAYLLAGEEGALEINMRKGGVALLTCDGEPSPGATTLEWLLTPKVLRLL